MGTPIVSKGFGNGPSSLLKVKAGATFEAESPHLGKMAPQAATMNPTGGLSKSDSQEYPCPAASLLTCETSAAMMNAIQKKKIAFVFSYGPRQSRHLALPLSH
jgi:hypothetical protein